MLEHLQIIHEAKLDLKKALLQDKANQERALNILVTNPFLYPIVLDILTRHSQEDSDFYFNLSSSPIAESTIKIIANHHFDLIIGRKYIDSSLITLALPRNPVYVFISSHCQIYDRHQQFLPFISKYLDGMKESTFVLFENSAGVQDYINKRFNEVGIHITKAIQVESVIDAINTAISLGHKGMALTNQYIAKKLFPANDYNLLNLPKNTLNFDNAIMYEKGANEQINDLANFLKINLSKIIN
ncbi:hypothetical protein EQ500_02940 [Lactobacillus sp. XV13L]|nr:hypothetical protein [Lactobacillus sp. XV13L]